MNRTKQVAMVSVGGTGREQDGEVRACRVDKRYHVTWQILENAILNR